MFVSYNVENNARVVKRNSEYKTKKATYHSVSCLGAPEETRTPDLLIRSQTLYPAELPAHMRSYQPQVIYYHSLMKNASVFFILFLNMRNYLSSQY